MMVSPQLPLRILKFSVWGPSLAFCPPETREQTSAVLSLPICGDLLAATRNEYTYELALLGVFVVVKSVALSLLLTEPLRSRACLRMDLSGEINAKRQQGWKENGYGDKPGSNHT